MMNGMVFTGEISASVPIRGNVGLRFRPDGQQTGNYPETLVLYRMRPTVSMQVGSVLRGAADTAV